MNVDLSLLFQTVLLQSLKAAVLITSIFGLRFLFGNRLSPAVKHGIWLLVPVALLVTIPSPWSIYNLLPDSFGISRAHIQSRHVQSRDRKGAENTVSNHPLPDGRGSDFFVLPSPEMATIPTSERPTINETNNVSTPPSVSHLKILTCIWLLGCTSMSLLFMRQLLVCRRWIANASPLKDGRVLNIFEQCTRHFGLRCWILALKSDDVASPFLVGVVRPRLLLPRHFVESATNEDIENVFFHELAHLKRYDAWTSWLMSFLLVLHWFNPFLWLAVRLMNDDREQACDVLALKKQDWNRRKNYSLLLVTLAEQGMTPQNTPGLVGLSETARQVAGRLEAIRQIGSWKPFWMFLVCVPVLLLALTAVTDAQNRKQNHGGYFNLIFSKDRYSNRFDEFDGKSDGKLGTTSGYIRELLGDAEEVNHELRLVVRKIRSGDAESDLLENAVRMNVKLRILMDEIRSPELRMDRKENALKQAETLLSLHRQTMENLRRTNDRNPSLPPLVEETHRLTDRLARVVNDLRLVVKLNGYAFELIEESEGIQFRLGVLLDEIRGPSSLLDRKRSADLEIKDVLAEYRLWNNIGDVPYSLQEPRNDLVRIAADLQRIDANDSRTERLLEEEEKSVVALRQAIRTNWTSDRRQAILQLSETTSEELRRIFREHP